MVVATVTFGKTLFVRVTNIFAGKTSSIVNTPAVVGDDDPEESLLNGACVAARRFVNCSANLTPHS